MGKVYAFMADGMEEVECLAVVDMLRRAGVPTETVSIMGRKNVVSSHQVSIEADILWEEAEEAEADILFLPGGMPGTTNLGSHKGLCELLKKHNKEGKHLAAICAAPSVLGDLGLLEGKKATCYPGFESHLTGATYTSQGVVTDGTVTTARGVGFAIDLGLELVRILKGEEKAQTLKESIQHP
jgi:4-methyl-5(b-hydroxyethyl)-thiazole monophosphate biosynthesis